jgi:hypothetical protein
MPNRIFLFGEVGTGKSTICAAIALYFHETKGLTPRINAVENPSGTRYLQDWVRQLRKGNFPGKTDTRIFARIDVGFVDRHKQERVGFTFFEVSGENLRLMDPTDLEHESRNNQLDLWLEESDTILVVGSALPEDGHRYTLQNFLEYLEYKKIHKPTCLVISEWDKLAESERRVPVEVARRLYSEAAKLLADRGSLSNIIPFSIGNVEGENSIAKVDFNTGTTQLIKWILDSMRYRT